MHSGYDPNGTMDSNNHQQHGNVQKSKTISRNSQTTSVCLSKQQTKFILLVVGLSAAILNIIHISTEDVSWLQLSLVSRASKDLTDSQTADNITASILPVHLIPDPNGTQTDSSESNTETISKLQHVPFAHLPKLEMIPYDELLQREGPPEHNCAFKGKVFVLDNMRDPMLPLFVSPDDVSWAMFSKPFWSDFNEALRKGNVFHDAPWNYLYPFYDQMIPRNHSKFILLVRDSTRDVVNSNMKMFVRGKRGRYKIPAEVQFDYRNWTMTPKGIGRNSNMTWKDFWMLTARGYEKHNQNVMDYFRAKGRLDDLLVLNLIEESKKMPFSEQWYQITQFLGCPNVSDTGLPHANTARDWELKKQVKQMDFFPPDFRINWQTSYTLPPNVQKIVDAVNDMNGTFDALKWKRLNESYGNLFQDKKQ